LLRRISAQVPFDTPVVVGEFTIRVRPVDYAAVARAPSAPTIEPQAAPLPAYMPPGVGMGASAPAYPTQGYVPPGVASSPTAKPPAPVPGVASRLVMRGSAPVQPSGPPIAKPRAKPAPPLNRLSAQSAIEAEAKRRAAADDVAMRREVHKQLLEHLDLAAIDASKLDDPSMRPKVLTALRKIVGKLEDRLPAGTNQDRLVGELADEALGLGPLERYLADPTISEVMVVGPEAVYVEREGKLVKTDARFTDDERVRAVIERIVTPLGRRIDESSPLVDARLKDGSRVNAVIRPIALRGSCITIRKFAKVPLTLPRLIELGALSDSMGRFLQRCVVAKKNVVISGGTGSGKTTLLNVLSAAIPEDERIITIEDAAELQLEQPHVVSLETRPANMEGKGEYTIRDLVRNALRMRPDRIVVGECRGGEALDMLQAMNTGHDGSLTTTHANSPAEALARLETLALMAGVDLPSKAIRDQIASSIHVIVQQSRFSDGSRKVTQIAEVAGLEDDGMIELLPIFEYERTGTGSAGQVMGRFRSTGYLPSFLDEFIVMGLIKSGEPFL
ncbi:MAG TPA: ATPase, T2SS/T4P/T4SS family, partial [Polyangiaceae bacterium]|nr:ATPase, T2SS/T4P/T4SS family [Polyangiaceae bacterium]